MAKPRKNRKQAPIPLGTVRAMAFAMLAGCGVFLSFPNGFGVEFPFLEWCALVPLLVAIRGRGLKSAFYLGLLTGFVTNLGGFYWISDLLLDFGHLPFWLSWLLCGLNALYQGLVFALFTTGVSLFHRRFGIPIAVSAPVAFVVAESLVPLIFPWYFANGQYTFTVIIQIVELCGLTGLTILLVLVNVTIYRWWESRQEQDAPPFRLVQIVGGLFVTALIFGVIRMAQMDTAMAEAPALQVGMVEADVGIFEKEARGLTFQQRLEQLRFNLVKHQRLSAQLEAKGTELIVWPESSYLPLGNIWFKRSDLLAVAVGANGTLHERRGSQWVAPDSELPPGVGGARLHAVWSGFEEGVYAVGDGGLIVHHDGRTWKAFDSGVGEALTHVTGQVNAEGQRVAVWAASDSGLAVHVNAAGEVSSERIPGGGRIQGLAMAPSKALVIAVGTQGRIAERTESGWTLIASPTRNHLHDVWITRGGEAVAVGDHGTLLVRSSGTWREVVSSAGGTLRAVWGTDVDSIVAVGDQGRILRFDGSRWRIEKGGVSTDLVDVHGLVDGRMFAVTASGDVLERGGDGDWRVAALPGEAPVSAVTGVPFQSGPVLPTDVAVLYASPTPLPEGSAAGTANAVDAVHPREKTAVQRGYRLPTIFGAVTWEDGKVASPRYNTALLVDGEGNVQGGVDKHHLLVFGEYIPFGDMFPVLYEWLPQASHFSAGKTITTIPYRGHRLGILICYEDILPRFTRRVVGKGAEVLINVTNDAWFGQTAEPWLHLALAVFRTVENRRFLVRSTNTGVSAFVDANGRILQHTSLDSMEAIQERVPLLTMETLFSRVGDWMMMLCHVAMVLFFIHGLWPGIRERR